MALSTKRSPAELYGRNFNLIKALSHSEMTYINDTPVNHNQTENQLICIPAPEAPTECLFYLSTYIAHNNSFQVSGAWLWNFVPADMEGRSAGPALSVSLYINNLWPLASKIKINNKKRDFYPQVLPGVYFEDNEEFRMWAIIRTSLDAQLDVTFDARHDRTLLLNVQFFFPKMLTIL